MNAILLSGGSTTTVLDSEVMTFVINGVKEFLGICTTPPLGIFLTIGILGTVAGLSIGLIKAMKGRK